MKKDIHPQTHPVVFVDTSCGEEFITTSTLTSDKKKDIDGIDHFIINVEISSASHPFYTGKQILVDTARRVEKFEERMKKSKALGTTKKTKKEVKEEKTETTPEVVTEEKVEEIIEEKTEEVAETPVVEEVIEEKAEEVKTEEVVEEVKEEVETEKTETEEK